MNRDTVLAALASIEHGQVAEDLYTDDATLIGAAPTPLPRDAFFAVLRAVTAAVPDWRYNVSDVVDDGDTVALTFNPTGTHTAPFALPGRDPIAATGITFTLPPERATFTLRDGRIAEVRIDGQPGSGVMGLVARVTAANEGTP